jgi:hypothetical protein
MMVGVIRGADGAILGQHAIDPTAPGGLQAQLNKLAAARGNPSAGALPPGGPNIPFPNTQMAQVLLQFPIRLPDGRVQWTTRPISVPNELAIPPGVYTLSQR